MEQCKIYLRILIMFPRPASELVPGDRHGQLDLQALFHNLNLLPSRSGVRHCRMREDVRFDGLNHHVLRPTRLQLWCRDPLHVDVQAALLEGAGECVRRNTLKDNGEREIYHSTCLLGLLHALFITCSQLRRLRSESPSSDLVKSRVNSILLSVLAPVALA